MNRRALVIATLCLFQLMMSADAAAPSQKHEIQRMASVADTVMLLCMFGFGIVLWANAETLA